MASTSKEQLEENCRYVAEHLSRFLDKDLTYSADEDTFHPKEEGLEDDGIYGYIQNSVYDIKLTTDLNGALYGTQLMVAGGGPNIYINTLEMEVEGYWGADEYHVPLGSRICQMIDDEIEQMRGN